LPPKEDFDPEEINLLYVAVTRAIKAVRLPLNLAGLLQDRGDVCLDEQAPPADEQSTEQSTEVGGQDAAEEADDTMSTEDKQEEWLRQHAASFGAAGKQIAFLLQRLDEARATRDASEGPVPDCPCARCWELSGRAT
jgi:F-box protein 18 (helicase)